MSVDFIYPAAIALLGLIVATIVFVVFSRVSNKIINFFQLYPESKGVLPISLKLISWGVSGIVFLLFLRFALQTSELIFTADLVTAVILASPKYILAVLLIVAGFYISRMLKEKSATYSFEQKNRVLFVVDFLIHMTFFFTALATIGVSTYFFEIFYMFSLAVIGLIVAITVGLAIGIPFGVGLYSSLTGRNPKGRK